MTHFDNLAMTDKAPVIALHSSASNGRQWNKLREDLEQQHIVETPELPGYDRKIDRLPDIRGLESVVTPMISHISRFGEPVHLVGHSFGGGVALKIALVYPQLVKSLTLYEPIAFHLLLDSDAVDRALVWELQQIAHSMTGQLNSGADNIDMSPFIDFWNGTGCWQNMPEAARDKIAGTAENVVGDFEAELGETWSLDDLLKLDIPTQVMMGMDSPAVAQRMSKLVFDGVPDAELVMLPGLDHMAPINAPNWVNPRIVQHIARADRRAERFSWPRTVAA